jgi:NADPH:quinone reductase-like Zn-dependent oxidoreductase
VRIRVRAAGLNFTDTLIIKGRYQDRPALPFVPGMEIAGRIDACGPGLPARLTASAHTDTTTECKDRRERWLRV